MAPGITVSSGNILIGNTFEGGQNTGIYAHSSNGTGDLVLVSNYFENIRGSGTDGGIGIDLGQINVTSTGNHYANDTADIAIASASSSSILSIGETFHSTIENNGNLANGSANLIVKEPHSSPALTGKGCTLVWNGGVETSSVGCESMGIYGPTGIDISASSVGFKIADQGSGPASLGSFVLTLAHTYISAPICLANNQSASSACKCSCTTTTCTAVCGSGNDIISLAVFGK